MPETEKGAPTPVIVVSVAVTVKLNVPTCIALPDSWPVELLSVTPEGKAPAVTA